MVLRPAYIKMVQIMKEIKKEFLDKIDFTDANFITTDPRVFKFFTFK